MSLICSAISLEKLFSDFSRSAPYLFLASSKVLNAWFVFKKFRKALKSDVAPSSKTANEYLRCLGGAPSAVFNSSNFFANPALPLAVKVTA